ncbi:MAG TPA: transglycosylase SLT domain-containing protein, partial [Alphaproteobacteria bacterium]|nr:transglycosylase SLT domain-containing protein [Alphaproteobacteria bacterium]
APIKAVTAEIARRKALNIKDETTEFLGTHLKILTKYRDMALDGIGMTSFVKPTPDASSEQAKDPLTAKATLRLWGEMAMEFGAEQFGNAKRKLVPFLKNTAYPAVRRTLGPYIGAATNFVAKETASFAKEIRLFANDMKKELGITIKTETRDVKRAIGGTINMPVSFRTAAVSTLGVVGLTASLTLGNAFTSASGEPNIEPETKEPVASVQADVPKPKEYKAIRASWDYNFPPLVSGKADYFGPKHSLNSKARHYSLRATSKSPWDIDALLNNPRYEHLLLKAAHKMLHMNREEFFEKLILTESSGNQLDRYGNPVTSIKGAIGIAQVMPATAKKVAQSCFGEPLDWKRFRLDEDYNSATGQCYFEEQYDEFGNNILAALAYNGGPKGLEYRIDRYGVPVHHTAESMLALIRSIQNDENRQYVIMTMMKAKLIPFDQLGDDVIKNRKKAAPKHQTVAYSSASPS